MAMIAAVLVVAVAALIGLVSYWPGERTIERPENLRTLETERAEVVGVELTTCPGPANQDCWRVTAELESGPDAGERVRFTMLTAETDFDVGDDIRVYKNPVPEEAVTAQGIRVDPYGFSDFERRAPLGWLAAAFAVLVLLAGRWQGLRALAGLAASLALIVLFIVPSILEGNDPTGVALTGALAVMLVTIFLAHGVSFKTLAASLGTTVSLLLTVVLADAFTGIAHLSGVSSDEAIFLRATQGDISLQGLLLAGMVIGALGVLDDLTVSQASTVMALRRANPSLGFRALFRSALDVGRDHITATVNTLVLAYAGASLPILLVFSLADTSLSDAVNFEAVAEEIIAMLVGSIGLITAVPVTTALAALLAASVEPARLEGEHAHAH